MANTGGVVLLDFEVKDGATSALNKISNKTKDVKSSTDRLINTLRLQEIELKKGKDAMLRAKAAMDGAKLSQIRQIKVRQDAVEALRQEQQAEKDAAAAKQAASTETVQSVTAVDRMTRSLELQRIELEQGKDAMMLHKAVMEGASLEQLSYIKSTQNAINAKKAQIEAERQAAAATDAASEETNQAKSSVDRLIQSLQIQEIQFRDSGEEAVIYRARLDGATKEQEDQIRALYQSIQAHKNHSLAMSGATRQMRYLRGMAGQMGHQVQDIAVQMQMGTNGMLVFAQQGSQVASLLGPYGPVVGAFLAVGAAVAVFFDETEGATDALKDIREQAKTTAQETRNLTNELRTFLAVDLAKDIREQEDALKALEAQEKERNRTLRLSSQAEETRAFLMQNSMAMAYGGAEAVAGLTTLTIQSADAVRDLNEANDQQAGSIQLVTNKIKELKDQRLALLQGGNPFFKDSENSGKAAKEIERNLERIRVSMLTSQQKRDEQYTQDLQAVAQATWLSIEERERISLQIVRQYNDEKAAEQRKADKEARDLAYKQSRARIDNLMEESDQLLKAAIQAERDREKKIKDLRSGVESVRVGTMNEVERIKHEEEQKLAVLAEAQTTELAEVYDFEQLRQAVIMDSAKAIRKIENDAAQARIDALTSENDAMMAEIIANAKEEERIRKEAQAVDIGVMSEIDQIKAREQQKLEALREAEEAKIELSRSYAEIRKDIARETADAIIDAHLREGNLSELQRAQIEGTRQRAEFEKKTERDKTAFVLGELDDQLSGIARYNKKAFAIQKAVQIAQAIMNTHTAATKALASYPPPLNAVFAALAVANGMAQVAQIKAQSFEGGGFTGIGPRSGGVDGKGGFPAILHPNETVIDHTKGQGMGGVTIVNNIDASGAGPEVDQKIVAAMEITSQQTVKQVQDLLRRQRLV